MTWWMYLIGQVIFGVVMCEYGYNRRKREERHAPRR